MDQKLDKNISAIRHFNRGFSRRIGLLREGLLDSSFTLSEARILYEIATSEAATASAMTDELGIDSGQLSRILSRLENEELLARVRSESDGRQRLLKLTAKGTSAFELINEKANKEIAAILRDISTVDQSRLLAAMSTIEELLFGAAPPNRSYIIRPPEPGDLGWIVYRHGVIYAREYGWNEEFEALVAGICADFLSGHDPKKERCWIAEMDGRIVGSIALAKSDEKDIARLRILLVEPEARGLGLGHRLVDECLKFARRAHYKKVTLFTYGILAAARRIYEDAGFELVKEEKCNAYGRRGLTRQIWSLALDQDRRH